MTENDSSENNGYYHLMDNINSLFGRLYKYNLSLLNKSNNPERGYSGEEVFDFFITSHGQSFLKSLYLGHVESKGLMLNCRSIIEGLAVKEMLKSGEISNKQIELLKYQDGLVERKHYKKFTDIAPEAMFPEQMNENYSFCYDNFSKILKDDYGDKEIKNIAFSNIPFLCNPKTTFTQIVEKYLGSDLGKLYRVLSVVVHPNPNIEISKEFTAQAIVTTVKLLEKEYNHLNSFGYTVESHYLLTSTSRESDKYILAIRKIATALETIQKNFCKNFENNYVSNTMHSISMILQEIAVDRMFGFQEQVKCKIKPLIEVISSFYKNYIVEESVEDRYELLLEHTKLKIFSAIGIEYNFENAYMIYKKIYPAGVDLDNFRKMFFAPTGYSINEKGESPSINSMVKDAARLIKDDSKALTFSDTLLIDYVESQMLSHANGYMWFSNSGAFTDTNNVIPETCFLLIRIFEYLNRFYNDVYKKTNEYKYRKTSNIFRDAAKEIYNACKTIFKLQKKPMVYLNNA